MRKVTIILAVIAFVGAPTLSADQTVSGDVFGTWYSGETITVVGDIRIPTGQNLLIEPDVDVLFTGLYKFTIEGLISAVGTQDQMIIFTRAYSNEDCRWRGFRFDSADDASILEYCQVEWAWGYGPYPEVRGGGVWVMNCSPTFRFCHFNDNFTHNEYLNGSGGAICTESGCFSLIEFNHIVRNQADGGGGISVGWESDPVIRYNIIEDNEAFLSGGGIYVSANAQATIYGNVIRNNTSSGPGGGGGITLWSLTIWYGKFSYLFDNLIINNRAIYSGSAPGGGGIFSNHDTSRIYNNTIVGNEASQGGGLYVGTASFLPPLVTNSIFWDNTAPTGPQIYADPLYGSTVTVTYCDVEGGYSGTGNIDVDPLFSDAAAGDFHLTWGSLCKNAGDNSILGTLIEEDFEGDPRIWDGTVDIGADEFHPHLYHEGSVVPGQLLTIKVAGTPTAPVMLGLGAGIQGSPQTTQYGDLYLQWPVIRFALGQVPSDGILQLQATVPGFWLPDEQKPLQALVGPLGNAATLLTNLRVLVVE